MMNVFRLAMTVVFSPVMFLGFVVRLTIQAFGFGYGLGNKFIDSACKAVDKREQQ